MITHNDDEVYMCDFNDYDYVCDECASSRVGSEEKIGIFKRRLNIYTNRNQIGIEKRLSISQVNLPDHIHTYRGTCELCFCTFYAVNSVYKIFVFDRCSV